MEDELNKTDACCASCAAPEAVEPAPAAEPAPVETTPAAECAVAQECAKAEENPVQEPVKEEKERRPLMEATQQMVDDAKRILETMLSQLALEGTVKGEKHASKINLLVSSSDAGRIIGRKGASLEAFQLLLNRMLSKGEPTFPKIYIDIDGYSSHETTQPDGTRAPRHEHRRFDKRERFSAPREEFHDHSGSDDRRGGREENLRQQALDAAKEVRHWGEDFTLPEMNAHDRRIIHITLENEADITTESVGEGNLKRVVVKLKK